MAQRRMVSLKIIDSAKFIKMPISSQALYFHLIARADDDGIVEAFNVMRMTGSTEDDLRILIGKEFVTVLNEDLVTYINDWNEHNLIRADRKVDSIYKNLLIKIVPDILLVEKKPRSDLKKNGGQSTDCPLTDTGQHRLGKDRLGEDSLGKFSKGEDEETSDTISTLKCFSLFQKNISPNMTPIEFEKLKSWLEVMDDSMICLAINIAAENNKRSYAYINSILTRWNNEGIKNEEQYRNSEAIRNKSKEIKPSIKPTGFHNFPNASTDIYADAIEKLINSDY